MIFVFLLCIGLCVLYHLSKKRNAIPIFVDHLVASVLASTGSVDPDDDDAFAIGSRPGVHVTKFRAHMVMLAKAEFGLLKRLESNRLMVRKFLLGEMRSHGLRPQHIAAQLDIIVSLFFIPSDADVVAHQVGATATAFAQEEKMHDSWESYYGYFGRMFGFARE